VVDMILGAMLPLGATFSYSVLFKVYAVVGCRSLLEPFDLDSLHIVFSLTVHIVVFCLITAPRY